MDVGLLAGLEDTEVLLDGAVVGDDPRRARGRAMGGPVPGGPALTLRWSVGMGV
jgi:hypothetical protein